MESFRRQLATGQTSVMDWDIIYIYVCIFALVLFFLGVCVSVCAAEYRKKEQKRPERHRGGQTYKEECRVYQQRD